jgi:hypothetical protein
MGSPSKYSIEWYGNEGYQAGLKGAPMRPPHDGLLDRMGGISHESQEKRDAYINGYEKGQRERNR